MIDGGLPLNSWKKKSFLDFVFLLTEEGNIDSSAVKQICPSARTVVREIKKERTEILQEICLLAGASIKKGQLSVAIDHKHISLNETYKQNLGILLIVNNGEETEK